MLCGRPSRCRNILTWEDDLLFVHLIEMKFRGHVMRVADLSHLITLLRSNTHLPFDLLESRSILSSTVQRPRTYISISPFIPYPRPTVLRDASGLQNASTSSDRSHQQPTSTTRVRDSAASVGSRSRCSRTAGGSRRGHGRGEGHVRHARGAGVGDTGAAGGVERGGDLAGEGGVEHAVWTMKVSTLRL